MLSRNLLLSYYKRKDIQEAMVKSAKNREVAVRFGEGFGKRPDVLKFSEEILDLAKQGATSFHSSEELWENPKLITPELKKADVEKIRKGWDLILDIDSPYWEIAKITAWLIIQGLKDHGIETISIKFSGNKGFHIGVPFESFPDDHNGMLMKRMFPIAARCVASYLIDYITEKYILVNNSNEIIFGQGLGRKFKISYTRLESLTGKNISELTTKVCSKCKKKITKESTEPKAEFICPKCGRSEVSNEQFLSCQTCNVLMQKTELKSTLCQCGSNSFFIKFDPLSIIEVDTILISPRHLCRMVYSLHEKSGLASIPFNPEKVLEFEKKFAMPLSLKVSKHIFIDRDRAKKDEAKILLERSMEKYTAEEKKEYKTEDFVSVTEAIPEVLFPPCITKMLEGIDDGKKRCLFILVNFLSSAGWDYERMEKFLKDWNDRNSEPLKEQLLLGQVRYHKRNKEKILPPNCDNESYYKGLRVCCADNFCKKIKNPLNYSILKSKIKRAEERKSANPED